MVITQRNLIGQLRFYVVAAGNPKVCRVAGGRIGKQVKVLDIAAQGGFQRTLRINQVIQGNPGFDIQVVLYKLPRLIGRDIGYFAVRIISIAAPWPQRTEKGEPGAIFDIEPIVETVLMGEVKRYW